MNITKSIFTLALSSLIFVGCKKTETDQKTTSTSASTVAVAKKPLDPNAKLAKTSFTIDGMTCPEGCAKTIEKELNETDGVKTATVDFDKKLATVEFDTNIQTPDKLVQIVQKTGDGQTYKVSNVK